MKPAARAPFYCAIYHGLAEVARKHGYALTIHGTMHSDFDLVACPWVDAAVAPEVLVAALKEHLGACDFPELTRHHLQSCTEEQIQQAIAAHYDPTMQDPERKPHGRLAWNLYLEAGSRIDLSIMPRTQTGGVS